MPGLSDAVIYSGWRNSFPNFPRFDGTRGHRCWYISHLAYIVKRECSNRLRTLFHTDDNVSDVETLAKKMWALVLHWSSLNLRVLMTCDPTQIESQGFR